MASAAQIAANWLNAREGAGPRTPRQGGDAVEPVAGFARGAPQHRAPDCHGEDPARIVTLGKQSRFIE
jgi:hypothetical protein